MTLRYAIVFEKCDNTYHIKKMANYGSYDDANADLKTFVYNDLLSEYKNVIMTTSIDMIQGINNVAVIVESTPMCAYYITTNVYHGWIRNSSYMSKVLIGKYYLMKLADQALSVSKPAEPAKLLDHLVEITNFDKSRLLSYDDRTIKLNKQKLSTDNI